VLSALSILLGLAFLRIGPAADRSAVRAAVVDAAGVFAAARNEAVSRRSAVGVTIDTSRGTLVVRSDTTLLLRRELLATYGVRLAASRDSMAFDMRGLGLGTANLSLVVRRGRVVDTLFLSRLGRVRY